MFGTFLKWLLRFFLFFAFLLVALIIAYRFVTPVSTLMLARYILHEEVEWHFVPLKQISPHLIAAVIVSEDARFCRHHGVDWGALREVIDEASDEGVRRGASTVSMQTAKNLFLWPSHSYFRKALEIPIALALDAAWPKRRILEVYLNIAEWGEGIFGIETAAETYFHKHASALDPHESALLAAVLPNPHRRNAQRPSHHVAAHARIVTARADHAELDCLR
ncbi:MAG: monofunctional biosynthetic peptidoglycan transglycosylase [Beijerinckiaceae bacterium]